MRDRLPQTLVAVEGAVVAPRLLDAVGDEDQQVPGAELDRDLGKHGLLEHAQHAAAQVELLDGARAPGDRRRWMAARRDQRAHGAVRRALEVGDGNRAERRLRGLLQDRPVEQREHLARTGVREHPRRTERVAAERRELRRRGALAAHVTDDHGVARAFREHVVEVASDIVSRAHRRGTSPRTRARHLWELRRQEARLQRLGDVVLALVQPLRLGVQACAVERLRAVVCERQQEPPLVVPEGAFTGVAHDEDAERTLGDLERQTCERLGARAEPLG